MYATSSLQARWKVSLVLGKDAVDVVEDRGEKSGGKLIFLQIKISNS